MATPTYAQIEALMLDDLGANVTTDAPVTSGVANEAGRWINDAYASVWEIAGARLKRVPSSLAWTNAQVATGTLTGILADVGEVLHLFATQTAPTAITAVTTGTTAPLTSAALFSAAITAGMHITKTDVAADTFVAAVTDTSNLTMSRVSTAGSSSSTTFSPTTGAIELDRVELAQIQWLRANSASGSGLGTYAAPKLYAPVFVASALSTAVPGNLLVVEYWPSITGYYFPMHYAPQFLPMDASITTPDLNDIEGRDVAHIAALALCQNLGRAEFAPGIAAKISDKTQQALARKLSAMMDAKQDK